MVVLQADKQQLSFFAFAIQTMVLQFWKQHHYLMQSFVFFSALSALQYLYHSRLNSQVNLKELLTLFLNYNDFT